MIRKNLLFYSLATILAISLTGCKNDANLGPIKKIESENKSTTKSNDSENTSKDPKLKSVSKLSPVENKIELDSTSGDNAKESIIKKEDVEFIFTKEAKIENPEPVIIKVDNSEYFDYFHMEQTAINKCINKNNWNFTHPYPQNTFVSEGVKAAFNDNLYMVTSIAYQGNKDKSEDLTIYKDGLKCLFDAEYENVKAGSPNPEATKEGEYNVIASSKNNLSYKFSYLVKEGKIQSEITATYIIKIEDGTVKKYILTKIGDTAKKNKKDEVEDRFKEKFGK